MRTIDFNKVRLQDEDDFDIYLEAADLDSSTDIDDVILNMRRENETTSFDPDKFVLPSKRMSKETLDSRAKRLKIKKQSVFYSLLKLDFINMNSSIRKRNQGKQRTRSPLASCLIFFAIMLMFGIIFSISSYMNKPSTNNPEDTYVFFDISATTLVSIIVSASYNSFYFIPGEETDFVASSPVGPFNKFFSKYFLSLFYALGLLVLMNIPLHIVMILKYNYSFWVLLSSIGMNLLYSFFICNSSFLITHFFSKLIQRNWISNFLSLSLSITVSICYPLTCLIYSINKDTHFILNYFYPYIGINFDCFMSLAFCAFLAIASLIICLVVVKLTFYSNVYEDKLTGKKSKMNSKILKRKVKRYSSEFSTMFHLEMINIKKPVVIKTELLNLFYFVILLAVSVVLAILNKNDYMALSKTSSQLFFLLKQGIVIFSMIGSITGLTLKTSTSFSRDSKSLIFLRSMKISIKKYINAKVFVNSFLSILQSLAIFLTVSILLEFNVYEIIVYSTYIVGALLLISYICITVDIFRPKLDLENDNMVLNNNLNLFISIILILLFFGIYIGITFLGFVIEHNIDDPSNIALTRYVLLGFNTFICLLFDILYVFSFSSILSKRIQSYTL